MKKLIRINGAEALTSKQQKKITAGLRFPNGDKLCCGCILQNKKGSLELLKLACHHSCPGESEPISGLDC